MDNDHIDPTFAGIVTNLQNLSVYKPAPVADMNTYQVPTDTGELAKLMGSIYRDAHATGYAEGYSAGELQGIEDAERSTAEEELLECYGIHEWVGRSPYCAACGVDKGNEKADTITHMVIQYAELWAEARRAISNMECVIRQLAEMDNGQIKATLQGTIWCLQAQLDKGDK